ncbi:hypothetical protein M422DRAFT_31990 [Sphaerobolus stellatus SS14]|uniref:Uncharacterized protein n=1 Tax=Sphaerobolus stellatus (strain SS14) TaxID=990650 RepID=A0A0C9VSV1_SPHS4|nr:hypothetical protein M422DRAFT_31990 [Sphaerobolus stellatus SS14]
MSGDIVSRAVGLRNFGNLGNPLNPSLSSLGLCRAVQEFDKNIEATAASTRCCEVGLSQTQAD